MFGLLSRLLIAAVIASVIGAIALGCSYLPGGTPKSITESAFGGEEPACEWYQDKIRKSPNINDTELARDYAFYNLLYVQLNEQEARDAIDWLRANC